MVAQAVRGFGSYCQLHIFLLNMTSISAVTNSNDKVLDMITSRCLDASDIHDANIKIDNRRTHADVHLSSI